MIRLNNVVHGVLDRTAAHMRGGITQDAVSPTRAPYPAFAAAIPRHFGVHAGRDHGAAGFHDDLSPRELMASLRAE